MTEFKSWDEMSKLEQLRSEFSDFHKEVHGFRPRFMSVDQFDSIEWIEEQLDKLSIEAARAIALEIEKEQKAIARFESRVSEALTLGAKDRATALRWILDAESWIHAESDEVDYEIFCYKNGLPYNYFEGQV